MKRPSSPVALRCFRFSESESKMEVARDMFFDAVTVPTGGDFDDDDDTEADEEAMEAVEAVRRLRFADADFPSVLVTLGVVNAASWAPFFALLLAEPLLGWSCCSVLSFFRIFPSSDLILVTSNLDPVDFIAI